MNDYKENLRKIVDAQKNFVNVINEEAKKYAKVFSWF
jgi:hypothetical protein